MQREYVQVDRKVLKRIRDCLKAYSFETGGILGSRNGMISDFEFDEGIRQEDSRVYVPNIGRLNQILFKWKETGIEFAGLVHSHYDKESLSLADIRYGMEIIRANDLTGIYMPIYVQCSEDIWFYWVSEDEEAGQEIMCQLSGDG